MIKIWDIKKFMCLKTLRGHTDKVLAITKINFTNNNNNNNINNCNYLLRKNNFTNIEYEYLNDNNNDDYNKSKNKTQNNKNKNNNLICSCSADSKIKFWDLNSGACVKSLRGHGNWVTSILSFSDEVFLSGDAEGKLIIWDFIEFKKVRKINAHANHWINSICKLTRFSFATCSGDCTIKLWDIANSQCFKVLRHESNVWGIVTMNQKIIDYNNSSNNNTNKDDDCKNCSFNISLNNLEKNDSNKNNDNLNIFESQNMKEEEIQFIISCSSDGHLKKWNLVDFTCANFEGDLNIVKSISLLDRSRLLSLGWDGNIKIWDTMEKCLLNNLNGTVLKSDSFVNAFAVINKNTVATCDEDKCVKIWFNVS